MNPNLQFGELIEQGQAATTNTMKTALSDTANSVSGQIGFNNETNTSQPQANQTQAGQVSEQTQGLSSDSSGNEFTKDMVKDFYAPSAPIPQDASAQVEAAQTQQRLAQVRQRIFQEQHNEVYFNAVLNADAPKQREESVAERVERQEMEDLKTEEQKKKDELPVAVLREQMHTEGTPGASG